jgi:hypothetical protein
MNYFEYARNLLENGVDGLRIARSKNEFVFDEILIRKNLEMGVGNQNVEIISFSENENNTILKFTNDYKKFLYGRITESLKVKSKLFNAITIINIFFNLKLYFEIKIFKNEIEAFLEETSEQSILLNGI